jgi:hypothetical protein
MACNFIENEDDKSGSPLFATLQAVAETRERHSMTRLIALVAALALGFATVLTTPSVSSAQSFAKCQKHPSECK